MQTNPFAAPTLPDGYDAQQTRSYSSLMPWLPLTLSGASLVFLVVFFVSAIVAVAVGFSNVFDDDPTGDLEGFGAAFAIALVTLILWLVSALAALVSLVVAVAKGYTRSLWMTPAVLLAWSPVWLALLSSLN